MAELVVDSSAVLAALHADPGGPDAQALLPAALISAANHAEVLGGMLELGVPIEEARHTLARLGYQVVPADQALAEAAATLHHARRDGLSLADRFCLALAAQLQLPVLTADRTWTRLDLGLDIRLIR